MSEGLWFVGTLRSTDIPVGGTQQIVPFPNDLLRSSVYVSTSCVTCVRLAEWSSVGSANRDSIAQAQRVGLIATGILLYLLFFLIDFFYRVFRQCFTKTVFVLFPAFMYLS